MAYHKIRKDQAAEPPLLDLPAVAEEAPAAAAATTEAAAAGGS
jgi:hypothetical protein